MEEENYILVLSLVRPEFIKVPILPNKSEDETFYYEDKISFDKDDECCICLEKDELCKTGCNHIICKNCIPQMKKQICPMCRKKILQKKSVKINKVIENNELSLLPNWTFAILFGLCWVMSHKYGIT
jgi:hypothetical protein